MLKYLYLFVLVLLFGCDDGDIINVVVDFDDTLSLCPDTSSSYFLYNTKNDPSESLTLLFPASGNTTIFPSVTTITVEELPNLVVDDSTTLTIDGSTVRFNLRSYNRNISGDELCDIVTPADLVIVSDNEATSGSVEIVTTFVDDDNDGISSLNENRDPNGDGDFSDAQDSDNDGIPDYLDEDDDNDNVPTADENPDPNGDGDLTDAQNTDGDDFPDYLDPDDDDDGIITRLEDVNENENPRDVEDQVMNTEGVMVFRYLYNGANAMEAFPDSGLIDNAYIRTYTSVFTVNNIGLEILDATVINLGTYTSAAITITQAID